MNAGERATHKAGNVEFHMRLAPAATFPTGIEDFLVGTQDIYEELISKDKWLDWNHHRYDSGRGSDMGGYEGYGKRMLEEDKAEVGSLIACCIRGLYKNKEQKKILRLIMHRDFPKLVHNILYDEAYPLELRYRSEYDVLAKLVEGDIKLARLICREKIISYKRELLLRAGYEVQSAKLLWKEVKYTVKRQEMGKSTEELRWLVDQISKYKAPNNAWIRKIEETVRKDVGRGVLSGLSRQTKEIFLREAGHERQGRAMKAVGSLLSYAGRLFTGRGKPELSAKDSRIADEFLEAGSQTTHTADGVDFPKRLTPAAPFWTSFSGYYSSGYYYGPMAMVVDALFWIAETQVTYELWHVVRQWALQKGYTFWRVGREGSDGDMGQAPSSRRHEPVTDVNWRDSIVWCNALSEMLGYDPVYTHNRAVIRDATNATACDNAVQENRNGFRLPTNDEWELAARYKDGRVWTPRHYASGATANTDNAAATQAVAWYSANAGGSTRNVGTLAANALGIYDMSGNVWEWTFTRSGSARVYRGGCWYSYASELQVGFVGSYAPSRAYYNLGFRPVRTQF